MGFVKDRWFTINEANGAVLVQLDSEVSLGAVNLADPDTPANKAAVSATGALLVEVEGGSPGGGDVVITDPLTPSSQAGVIAGCLKAAVFTAGGSDITGYAYGNLAPDGGGLHLGTAAMNYAYYSGRWTAVEMATTTPASNAVGLVTREVPNMNNFSQTFTANGSSDVQQCAGGYNSWYAMVVTANGTVTTVTVRLLIRVGSVATANEAILVDQTNLNSVNTSGGVPMPSTEFVVEVTNLVMDTATEINVQVLAYKG